MAADNNVTNLSDRAGWSPRGRDNGGDGGYSDGMEGRLRAVEQSIAKIDATLPTLATKADLAEEVGSLRTEMHKGFADQTKWTVGTALALGAVGLTVITFVLNNAVPRPPQAPAGQPTVIVVPAPQPAPGAAR